MRYALVAVALLAACGDSNGPGPVVEARLHAQRFSDNLGAGCQLQLHAVVADTTRSIAYEIEAVFGGRMAGEFFASGPTFSDGSRVVASWDVRWPSYGDTAKWRFAHGNWSPESTASCETGYPP